MAARRIRRYRRKYKVDPTVLRAKVLLPQMYPRLELALVDLMEIEFLVFDVLEAYGVPSELWDYYLAFAKRAASLGLRFWDATFEAEKKLLIAEFKTRGLSEDILYDLEDALITWLKKKRGIRVLKPTPNWLTVGAYVAAYDENYPLKSVVFRKCGVHEYGKANILGLTLKWRYQALREVSATCNADIDGDGNVETIYVCPWEIGCLDADGNLKWYYEIGGYAYFSTVYDVDGDGKLEVLTNCDDGYIYCLKYDGSLKWRYLTDGEPWESTQVVYDAVSYTHLTLPTKRIV